MFNFALRTKKEGDIHHIHMGFKYSLNIKGIIEKRKNNYGYTAGKFLERNTKNPRPSRGQSGVIEKRYRYIPLSNAIALDKGMSPKVGFKEKYSEKR